MKLDDVKRVLDAAGVEYEVEAYSYGVWLAIKVEPEELADLGARRGSMI